MNAWKIPAPIPIDWEMRRLESAKISSGFLDDGRFHQLVQHAPLPGVTPRMCLWYLENVDRELTWRGHTALAYRFWHPVDHIYFKRLGRFGAGDRWHIVEAFGAQPRFLRDGVFQVTKLDQSGFRMEVHALGTRIAEVDERWQATPLGLLWEVEMTVGTPSRLLNRLLIRLRMPLLVRWRQHNVEEAGNLPHFLPELYAAYH